MNPFLAGQSMHTPTPTTDHYGDTTWLGGAQYHLAGIMLAAFAVIVAMKLAGFRAMVGIGRG